MIVEETKRPLVSVKAISMITHHAIPSSDKECRTMRPAEPPLVQPCKCGMFVIDWSATLA